MVIDQRKLDAGQLSVLVNEYKAAQIDNDRLGVLFKAAGFWSSSHTPELAAPYQLERPVVVSINDKTETLSTLGTIALIPLVPLFPLFMMYGCATGPLYRETTRSETYRGANKGVDDKTNDVIAVLSKHPPLFWSGSSIHNARCERGGPYDIINK